MNKLEEIEENIRILLYALKEQSYYNGFAAGKESSLPETQEF